MKIESKKAPGTWSENMFIDHWTPNFAEVHFGKNFKRKGWAQKLRARTSGNMSVIKGDPEARLRSMRGDRFIVVWSETHRIESD